MKIIGGVIAIVSVAVVGYFVVDRFTSRSDGTLDGSEAISETETPEVIPERPRSSGSVEPGAKTNLDALPNANSASEARTGVALVGRVRGSKSIVDRPVSLRVEIEGQGPIDAASAADGRFRVDVGMRPEGGSRWGRITAGGSGEEGQCIRGFVLAADSPDVIDLGEMMLADVVAVGVRVTKDGVAVPGASVFVGSIMLLGIGPYLTDEEGEIKSLVMTTEKHVVRAFHENAWRSDVEVVPADVGDGVVELALKRGWDLTVRVRSEKTGRGEAGVELRLMTDVRIDGSAMMRFEPIILSPPAPTDASGTTVIANLDPEYSVRAEVAAPNVPVQRFGLTSMAPGATAKPGTEELVITLPAGETFRFPIVADETPGPSEGSTVALSVPLGYGGGAPPRSGRVESGYLVIDDVTANCFNILATAEDGSWAIVRILGDAREKKIGSDAKFKRPRRLEIVVREPDGSPTKEGVIGLRNSGNIELAPERSLDAEGKVIFDGLPPENVRVHYRPPGTTRHAGAPVGLIDLATQPSSPLEVVLERKYRCVVQITVDGKKRLPVGLNFNLVGAIKGEVDEFVDAGRAEFDFRRDPRAKMVTLAVNATGCAPVEAELVFAPEDTSVPVRIDLESGGVIDVRVLPPADNRFQLGLQFTAPGSQSWQADPRYSRPQLEAELRKQSPLRTMDALKAGRYRVVDQLTGIVSREIILQVGSRSEIDFDLSRTLDAQVRVVGPEGKFEQLAVLSVEAEGLTTPMRGGMPRELRVAVNGEATIRLPGDRPVTIGVSHSELMAAPDGGSAVVTVPTEPVVLRLVKGTEATFRTTLGGVPQSEGVRVALFAAEPDGKPLRNWDVVQTDGTGRIAGYAAGRYTLWFDQAPAAPTIRRDVELGPETTDLGEIALDAGATLVCRLSGSLAREPMTWSARVTSQSPPYYVRDGHSKGTEARISGFGPGRFTVTIQSSKILIPIRRDLELTGSGEIVLDITQE